MSFSEYICMYLHTRAGVDIYYSVHEYLQRVCKIKIYLHQYFEKLQKQKAKILPWIAVYPGNIASVQPRRDDKVISGLCNPEDNSAIK